MTTTPEDGGSPLRGTMTDRPTLTAEALSARTGTSLRTMRRRIAEWRLAGSVRVYQHQRRDASGRPIGGVSWVVDADDYRALHADEGETAQAA